HAPAARPSPDGILAIGCALAHRAPAARYPTPRYRRIASCAAIIRPLFAGHPNCTVTDSSLAFVFPGQGSQSVGMLAELAARQPEVRAAFDEASQGCGADLWELSQDGPEERLNRTEFTQPALLAAGIAVWRAWQARGGAMPVLLSGHSLGEYTALAAAGALSAGDGARVARPLRQ